MTNIYPFRLILRSPDVEVLTGEAVTSAPPTSTKKIINAVPKVEMPKAVPDNVKKMTFSVSDFDTEQLPSTPPVQIEDTKTGVVVEAKESSTTGPELNTDGTIKTLSTDGRERNPDGTFKETKTAPVKEKLPEKKVEPQPILKAPAGKVEPVKAGKETVKTIGLPTKTQRDYAGFSNEETNALKQMSNEGFDLASRVLKENRELKKLEGSTYLQHEHAYVLDPEFQQTNLSVQRSSGEAEHWRQQLILAEQGKPVHDIKGWDNRTGQMVVGQEYQPNASLTESIRERLYACNNAAAQNKQKLESFPSKYSERIRQDSQAIESEIRNRFAWEQDSKLMDHTLSVEFEDGPRDVSLKQIKEDFTSLFPSYLRQNLGVRVAANMMIALKIQDAEIRQLKAGAQVTETIQEERRLVEPTSEHKVAPAIGKPVNGVTEFGGDPV